jgi:hypothetical protein
MASAGDSRFYRVVSTSSDHHLRSLSQPVDSDSDAESKFLDDIDRIAQVDYQVSDQDIVCARLKTVGIQEYTFKFETGMSPAILIVILPSPISSWLQD